MDIFEHFNPNKLTNYIQKCFDILEDGGIVFTNIPAFGTDQIFGEVFPLHIDVWKDDAKSDRLFSTLQVDGNGWPIHGHLVWATSKWWQYQFEQIGFNRITEVEICLQDKYRDYYSEYAPARRSLFVFGKNSSDSKISIVVDKIRKEKSQFI